MYYIIRKERLGLISFFTAEECYGSIAFACLYTNKETAEGRLKFLLTEQVDKWFKSKIELVVADQEFSTQRVI